MVILAGVIAAFVPDIDPGDSPISAEADVSDGGEDIVVEIATDGEVVVLTDDDTSVNTDGSFVIDVDKGDDSDFEHHDFYHGGEYTDYGFSGTVCPYEGESINDADFNLNLRWR